jgi:hypothetical protein
MNPNININSNRQGDSKKRTRYMTNKDDDRKPTAKELEEMVNEETENLRNEEMDKIVDDYSCIEQVFTDSVLNFDSNNNILINTIDELNNVVENVNRNITDIQIDNNSQSLNNFIDEVDINICRDNYNSNVNNRYNSMEIDDDNNKCVSKSGIISIFKNIYKNVHEFIQRFPLKRFQDEPSGTAFIIISRHGGYDLNKKKHTNQKNVYLDIDVINCPVPHLYRLISAPIAACSWGNDDFDIDQYVASYTYLEEFRNNNDNIDVDRLKNALEDISNYNNAHYNFIKDIHSENQMKLGSFEKKICKMKNSNLVIENRLGDRILNKQYQADKYTLSGIVIMFNITFRLPDILFETHPLNFFSKLEKRATKLKVDNDQKFRQRVDIVNKTITYKANTELLDCPIFNLYVNILINQKGYNNITVFIKEAPSFSDYLNINEILRPQNVRNNFETFTEYIDGVRDFVSPPADRIAKNSYPKGRRHLIYELDNFLLYSYFQYLKNLVHIDLSCGSLMLNDFLDKNPKQYGKHSKHFKELMKKIKEESLYGGKKCRSKKCNTKKGRCKKCNTKKGRCNFKKSNKGKYSCKKGNNKSMRMRK